MDVEGAQRAATLRLGGFEIEIRWSWLALLTTYAVAGVATALGGGHVVLGGADGIVVHAAAFVVLAMTAAIFHELGHAVTGLFFGRHPLGLVLKAGAAMRIEVARPGSAGDTVLGESLVALSGPLASALIALAYLNVSSTLTNPFAWAGLLALVDGLVNLVPVVAHTDGDRILRAITHPGDLPSRH